MISASITLAAFLCLLPWLLGKRGIEATIATNDVEPRINCNCTTRNNRELEYKVPNIVHYIWYNNKSVDFPFYKALSVLSAVKHIKPDVVYFHTDTPPKGKYFEMLKNISVFKVKFILLFIHNFFVDKTM